MIFKEVKHKAVIVGPSEHCKLVLLMQFVFWLNISSWNLFLSWLQCICDVHCAGIFICVENHLSQAIWDMTYMSHTYFHALKVIKSLLFDIL